MEETIESRHRKELKALDGERRAAVKKAKSTKGTKGKAKEDLTRLEAEFDGKLAEMKARHERELQEARTGDQHEGGAADKNEASPTPSTTAASFEPHEDAEDLDRQRRTEKARKKREKAREKERERERRIEEEVANAGPSARLVENQAIEEQLRPLGLRIREVPADGHCLYRAVAAHYPDTDYTDMRRKCADVMAAHEDDFAPFCELGQVAERGDEGNSLLPANYAAYVDRVRSSADWGGHLELRALSVALQRPIIVYSARSAEPLRIEEQQHDTINSDGISADEDSDFVPIRLSYHLNYYALGEHYNQVVPVEESGS